MGVSFGDVETANAGVNMLVSVMQWSLLVAMAVSLFGVGLFLSGYLRTFLMHRSRDVLMRHRLSSGHAISELMQRNN